MNVKYDNTIFYEGKECNALEIIRKLELCENTYYYQRKKGVSAQDAFDHCRNLKNKITLRQTSEETKISQNVIRKGFRNGHSIDEIKLEQQKKKEKEFQILEYFRKVGLPLDYESLTDFCNCEKLSLAKVYKRIQKGLNLYDAVQESFVINDKSLKNTKYIYYGVQLKSIA